LIHIKSTFDRHAAARKVLFVEQIKYFIDKKAPADAEAI
jgi:hypothetical protein